MVLVCLVSLKRSEHGGSGVVSAALHTKFLSEPILGDLVRSDQDLDPQMECKQGAHGVCSALDGTGTASN